MTAGIDSKVLPIYTAAQLMGRPLGGSIDATARKEQIVTLMFAIRVDIIEWVDDAQPGVVASRLIDAWGYEHTLIDKMPIFTSASLDRHSVYPQPGWLACEVVERRRDAGERDIISIDTEYPWHVASTTGTTHFEVLSEQLIES